MAQATEIVILEKSPEAVVRKPGGQEAGREAVVIGRLLSHVIALKQGDSSGNGDRGPRIFASTTHAISTCSSPPPILSFIQQTSVEPYDIRHCAKQIHLFLSLFPHLALSFPAFSTPLFPSPAPCFPDIPLYDTFPKGTQELRPHPHLLPRGRVLGTGLPQSR